MTDLYVTGVSEGAGRVVLASENDFENGGALIFQSNDIVGNVEANRISILVRNTSGGTTTDKVALSFLNSDNKVRLHHVSDITDSRSYYTAHASNYVSYSKTEKMLVVDTDGDIYKRDFPEDRYRSEAESEVFIVNEITDSYVVYDNGEKLEEATLKNNNGTLRITNLASQTWDGDTESIIDGDPHIQPYPKMLVLNSSGDVYKTDFPKDRYRSEATIEGFIWNDTSIGYVPYDNGTKIGATSSDHANLKYSNNLFEIENMQNYSVPAPTVYDETTGDSADSDGLYWRQHHPYVLVVNTAGEISKRLYPKDRYLKESTVESFIENDITDNYIPYYNGTNLVATSIKMNGTLVQITNLSAANSENTLLIVNANGDIYRIEIPTDKQRTQDEIESFTAQDIADGYLPYDNGTELTQSAIKVTSNGGGKIGVNVSNPTVAKLEINGPMKVGTSSATCNSNRTGAIRFNDSSDRMEYCNGSSWQPLGNQ